METHGTRATRAALGLLLGLASGCGSAPRAGGGGAPGPVDLGPRVSIELPGQPAFGALVRARVSVVNGGIHPMLIRAIDLSGQLPDPIGWLASHRGRLEFDERGRCRWRTDAGGETPPVFARGLIFPGEALTVERFIRVRASGQEVSVLYQELAPSARGGSLLFRSERSQPRRLQDAVFEPPSAARLAAFRRRPPGSEERLVLALGAQSWPVESRRTVWHLSWADPHLPGAILAEHGLSAAEVSRWDGGRVWLIRPPGEGAIYLLPDGLPAGAELERFPRLDFAVFDLADAALLTRSELCLDGGEDEELESFAPAELLDVLREARERGWRLEVAVLDPEAAVKTACVAVR
jgi:hypothetical protein